MATLVGYWKLDETSGTTLADSAGSNPATITGTLGNVSPPGAITFSDPNAKSFPGTSGGTAITATGTGLPAVDAACSISFWVTVPATGASDPGTVVALLAGSSTYRVSIFADGGIEVDGQFTLIAGGPPGSVPHTGAWVHIAATYDGSVDTIYVNGTSVGSATGATHNTGSATAVSIGHNNGSEYFKGSVDEVRIYNDALTPTEVTTLAGGSGVPPIGGTSVALTGISATVSRGTPSPAVSGNITGQALTASKGFARAPLAGLQIATSNGTLVPAIGSPIAGIAVSVSRGTSVPAVGAQLIGQSAAPSLGTMAPPSASSLTGQSATLSGGTMIPVIAVAATGQSAAVSRGTVVPGISPALSGLSSGSSKGSPSPSVSVAMSGQSSTASKGTLSVAGPSTAPIWQALITEGSGLTIHDTAAGTAVDLTLGGSTGWTSNTGGVGYNFGNNAALGAGSGALGSTKLQTALAGSTKCSLEFEVNIASFVSGNIVTYLGNFAVSGAVFFINVVTGGLQILSGDGNYTFAASTGLHVYLVEMDSNQSAGSRIKLKIDGVLQAPAGITTEMTPGSALDAACSTWSSNTLDMGTDNGVTAFNGSVFYQAIYAVTGIPDHTSQLIANNDAAPSDAITVALTGIAATIGRGILAVATSIGLIGNSSSASQGSVSRANSLTGLQASTSQGTLLASVSPAMSGMAVTTARGTQTASVSLAIAGQSATSARGNMGPPGSAFLSGMSATAVGGTVSPTIGVGLSGRSVTSSIGNAIASIASSIVGAFASATGGIFTPSIPVAQRKFLATSLVSEDVSLSLVSSDQARTLVEG